MSIHKRRYIRFSLDIPALVSDEHGVEHEIMFREISVGGCLAELAETYAKYDEIRFELTLPNNNRVPILGKPLYYSANQGIGIRFHDVSQFEQELVASIISEILEHEGLPLMVNPFKQPPQVFADVEPIVSEPQEFNSGGIPSSL